MLKTVVLSARNGSFSLKKQRFLKRIRIFVGIKKVYHTDYQRILCNDKNKCFSSHKDNALENISCICGQNKHFVEFIHIYRRGVIYHVPHSTEETDNPNGVGA